MAHDVPLGCAPDEYDDLISGTCSHLPYFSYLCNTESENSPINYFLPICRLKQGSRLPAYPVGE
ncbi:hypothetical protein ACJWVB_11140, partial [Klebsiella pneumoniae]